MSSRSTSPSAAAAASAKKGPGAVSWLALLLAMYAAVMVTLQKGSGGSSSGGGGDSGSVQHQLDTQASRLRTEIQDDFKKALADAKDNVVKAEKKFEEARGNVRSLADDGARRVEDAARASAARAEVIDEKIKESHEATTALRGTVDGLALAVRDLESRPAAVAAAPKPATPTPAVKEKPPVEADPVQPGPSEEQLAKNKAKVQALIADLASPDILKVFPACGQLGKLGDLDAVEPLVKVLKEMKDTMGRTAAASALGQLHACDAVPALIHSFLEKDESLVLQAGVAFTKITGQDSGMAGNPTRKEKNEAKDKWTKWWKEHEAEVRTRWNQPAKEAAPKDAGGKEAPKDPKEAPKDPKEAPPAPGGGDGSK